LWLSNVKFAPVLLKHVNKKSKKIIKIRSSEKLHTSGKKILAGAREYENYK
jgi:hypothetical protein